MLSDFAINRFRYRTGKLLMARFRNGDSTTVGDAAFTESPATYYACSVMADDTSTNGYTVEIREVLAQTSEGFDASSTVVIAPSDYALTGNDGGGTTPVIANTQTYPLVTSFSGRFKVKITSDPGSVIYYAFDGAVPYPGLGNVYTGTFFVYRSTILTAIAVQNGGSSAAVRVRLTKVS